jgi:K+-transporting ATPase KdpF subunit
MCVDATGFKGGVVDYAIAGVISLLLAIYLVYALLRPERF